MSKTAVLSVETLRLLQDENRPIYLFTLTAEQITNVAAIFRASRSDDREFSGYQRPEARQHVNEILEYLNSGDVLFPNALVLALTPKCRFHPGAGNFGTLTLPLNNGERPAWIVDGQQRALALSRCRRFDLPVAVTAFVADDIETMRDQFIRVNNAKPLPRGLLTELLPTVFSKLSPAMHKKRAASLLCGWLSDRKDSPFLGLIRRSTAKSRTAVISDTSLINAIQGNLFHPSGCLFTYQEPSTGQVDFEGCYHVLRQYWQAVKEVFAEAWGLPPALSRLSHGVGIAALGKLMDRVLGGFDLSVKELKAVVVGELMSVRSLCAWTRGKWHGLDLSWNELQNTPTHIRLLSDYLTRAYVGGRG